MKAYKGFNKDMTCRGFQFKEGETYEEDEARLCEAGFHACEAPIDCFSYYAPYDAVYHEVELDDVSDERRDDSKVVGKKIKIGAEIGIPGIVKAQVEYVLSLANPTQGDGAHSTTQGDGAHSTTQGNRAHSTTQGDWAHSTTQGDGAHSTTQGKRAHSTTQGDWAHSEVNGKESIAAAFGRNSVAKAVVGSWIVLAEYDDEHLLSVKAEYVDGVKIKADTWYALENGQIVEAEEIS